MTSLDIENHEELKTYLSDSNRLGNAEITSMQNLPGGVSNRAVLVHLDDGRAWVLKQALEKLRVAVDWFSDPARIHREALGMKYLHELAPSGSITPLMFEDHEHHILAMEAVPQPHENWKVLLLQGDLHQEDVQQFAGILAAIHRNAWEQRDTLKSTFDDAQYFESLRLEPYYAFAAQQVPEAAKFLNDIIAQTRLQKITLVHGDYSPKNILKYKNKLILLDHEVIHWGDPAFDVGFSMTHLLSKAHHLKEHRNAFAKAAQFYWENYFVQLQNVDWKEQLEERAVRHTLACLLARVAGRSPLEYLNEEERKVQRDVVVEIMKNSPSQIPVLIEMFMSSIYKAEIPLLNTMK
ncbi:MAG: aminoglycoside phosphotransferase family protein [Abditibacteriaceae bacterium]